MRASLLAGALALLGSGLAPVQAEMPKPQFGIKVSNPQPTPRSTGGTAVLNNQTFSVPTSVISQRLSPAEARRAKLNAILAPTRRSTAYAPPRNNNNSLALTNTTFSVPTSVVSQAGAKPQQRIVGVVSGRRLPNLAKPRCPAGVWSC